MHSHDIRGAMANMYLFLVPWAVHRRDIRCAMASFKSMTLPCVMPSNDIYGAMAHIKTPAGVKTFIALPWGMSNKPISEECKLHFVRVYISLEKVKEVCSYNFAAMVCRMINMRPKKKDSRNRIMFLYIQTLPGPESGNKKTFYMVSGDGRESWISNG